MNEFENDIDKSLKTLQQGGILLYPTDTIWGLGCDATNKTAINTIFDIKHRNPNKSMIILVADVKMIQRYVENPSESLLQAMKNANTPTTAIFNNAKNLPANLTNKDRSIAIRIASDEFCRELISRFQKPLVSTSANISDSPSPQNFSEISPVLLSQVDYTVHYRRNEQTKT